MAPPPRAFISGMACFMPSITERSNRSMVPSQASMVMVSSGSMAPPAPALLNSASSPPKRSAAVAIRAAMSASWVTSQRL